MRRIRRIVGLVLLVTFGVLLVGGVLFAFEVLTRTPLRPAASTTHASIGRQQCLDCHAPIADEWRQSYHYKSLTGPYWQDVRQLGYLAFFNSVRKPCMNCHAPANVLDLTGTASGPARNHQLGVECTPNIFRNPQGAIPSARLDDVESGVDCTACHVSKRGIVGTGRRPTVEHEVVADRRFQNPAFTIDTLCRTCHGATVEAWKETRFAAEGVTCLDCHMPEVRAASVAGGPERPRRSHTFPADKDDAMLRKAVNVSLDITPDGRARLRITNDRVGHFLPSGGNALSVQFTASDTSGRTLGEQKVAFGRDEALLLDFWPFNRNLDTRIAYGKQKEILFPLPTGHGTVEANVRYHDWMRVRKTIVRLEKTY